MKRRTGELSDKGMQNDCYFFIIIISNYLAELTYFMIVWFSLRRNIFTHSFLQGYSFIQVKNNNSSKYFYHI